MMTDRHRTTIAVAAAIAAAALAAEPAWAFETVASGIKTNVCSAYNAGKEVLITAAVLALIIGIAPMLWGQVKAKWMISCLVACMVFGQVGAIVGAFAGQGGSACG